MRALEWSFASRTRVSKLEPSRADPGQDELPGPASRLGSLSWHHPGPEPRSPRASPTPTIRNWLERPFNQLGTSLITDHGSETSEGRRTISQPRAAGIPAKRRPPLTSGESFERLRDPDGKQPARLGAPISRTSRAKRGQFLGRRPIVQMGPSQATQSMSPPRPAQRCRLGTRSPLPSSRRCASCLAWPGAASESFGKQAPRHARSRRSFR